MTRTKPGQVQSIFESWRRHCNAKRPHSAFGYKSPAAQRPPMHSHSTWTSQIGPPHTDLHRKRRSAPTTVARESGRQRRHVQGPDAEERPLVAFVQRNGRKYPSPSVPDTIAL
ncbi:MAG: hypothetical protein KDA50_03585 [Rhodobacteraceae bacterium]|nr:hypothetical protein [Paracoccaceae bacterium]